jgi:hypothetical protein
MFNVGNGLYIHNELQQKSGPLPGGGLWSQYPNQPSTTRSRHGIKVEIVEIHDVKDSLDSASKADFKVSVRIAGELREKDAPKDTRTPRNVATFTKTGIAPSVIPLVFSVTESDPDILKDPDDFCAIYPGKGRDNLYVYYDTRTQRLYGDVEGAAGDLLTAAGIPGVYNRVQIRFRVSSFALP